ncbi:hypothetical protein RND81_10G220000 [Saponaria officinalis]|uniref:RING-type E3 ubiquitin transferase n=1 Tax=Saponaria officinalis TaxID=3572 RepID=A0AAW1I524_SAPOF
MILTSNYNNDNNDVILIKNNQPRIINQSTTLPFDLINESTWHNLDFCLQHCLNLDKHVRQQVIHKLATYVTSYPKPASLVVSINQVVVYDAVLYDESDEDNAALKMTRVEELEFSKECCCSICLVNWTEQKNGTVTCMPCNHAFHDQCIVTWLKVSPTCPVCRFDLGQLLELE